VNLFSIVRSFVKIFAKHACCAECAVYLVHIQSFYDSELNGLCWVFQLLINILLHGKAPTVRALSWK